MSREIDYETGFELETVSCKEALVRAIENMEPPPCETCEKWLVAICGSEGLACPAFARYAEHSQHTSGLKICGKYFQNMDADEFATPNKRIYQYYFGDE